MGGGGALVSSILFLWCGLVCFARGEYNWTEKWLDGMSVDHFSFGLNRTFRLRYLVNTDHFLPGRPIFFYCGNEGNIRLFAKNTGFMWEIAPEFNAAVVFAEHRYYGETMPFGTVAESYKPENLGWLSSEQALADFAILIRHLHQDLKEAESSPVVAFGGSYGGMLAAWFRMKYPHVIVGALASSAPILQFRGLTPCWTFYDIVTKTFASSGPNCAATIKKSWAALKRFASSSEGREWVNERFQLCNDSRLESAENATAMAEWLSSAWSYLAMIDYPYPTNFLAPVPAWPVQAACKNLTDPNASDEGILSGIYQAVTVYLNYTGEKKCFRFQDEATPDLGTNGWNYQACTEMIMPMCSNGSMFEEAPWDLDKYAAGCREQLGVQVRPDWISTNYGGKDLRWASNIIFSNGLLDPWSGGGVLSGLPVPESVLVMEIPKGAHHFDLRAANRRDTADVRKARALERKMIHRWLSTRVPFLSPM